MTAAPMANSAVLPDLMFTRVFDAPHQLMLTIASLNTIGFEDEAGKTRVTVKIEVTRADPAAHSLAGMEEGWTQQLEKLDELIDTIRGEAK